MKITTEWLNEKSACTNGVNWATEHKLIGKESIPFIKRLIKAEKLDWANWLIARVMERKQYLAYAIYAAEQVIDIYEKKYPEDKRPRLAIEAAKKVLENDTEENRNAANAATYAAYANAAYAAYATAYAANAANAANAATYAATYAANAATYAAYATYAAAYAANATNAAAYAANATYAATYAANPDNAAKMKLKILNYGMKLLKGATK